MAACANSCVFAAGAFAQLSRDQSSSSPPCSPSGQLFGHSQSSTISSSSVAERRKGPSAVHGGSPIADIVGVGSRRRHARHIASGAQDDEAQVAQDEITTAGDSGILPSGEWPENFSLLNYEDLGRYFEPALLKPKFVPSSLVADVMTTTVEAVKASELLQDIAPKFENVTGLPVIDSSLKCVGVITKREAEVTPNPAEVLVGSVMTSPAITVDCNITVAEAAVVMLKHRIHRLPVVNEEGQLVGIVTRTDLFTALEHPSE